MNYKNLNQNEELARLSGDTAVPAKANACQALALVGDKEAVPALAALLDDAVLSDHARIALQSMPCREAGEALRKALTTVRGTRLAGVVASLVRRNETAAIPAIIALADHPETGALAALAGFATPEAIGAIGRQLKQTDPAKLEDARLAALKGASKLLALHQKDLALKLLKALLSTGPAKHVADAAGQLTERALAKTLFNSKSLDGWEGDPQWFRVHEGAIVAGSLTKPIPKNEFLVTTREFSNFELRLKVRLRHSFTNAGIQFRSKRVPNSREMIGYQADAGSIHWGGIYDESRRGTFLGKRTDAAKVAAMVNPLGWNDYRIRCKGPRVRLWVNGILTSDFTETDASVPVTGFIGVQIHSGPATEAEYRNIELTELA